MTNDNAASAADDGSLDGGDATSTTGSLWWALHRPETYALLGFTLAVLTLFGFGPAQEVVQTFLYRSDNAGPKTLFGITAAIDLALAVVAGLSAWLSIRAEDEDITWSAPVARCGLVLAVIAAAFALTSLIGALSIHTDHMGGLRIAG